MSELIGIKEAVAILLSGGRVQSPDWKTNSYIYITGEGYLIDETGQRQFWSVFDAIPAWRIVQVG